MLLTWAVAFFLEEIFEQSNTGLFVGLIVTTPLVRRKLIRRESFVCVRRVWCFLGLSLKESILLSNYIFHFFIKWVVYLAHEYVKVDDQIGTVGITDFAQSALGDIVFVDLPSVGDEFDAGDAFGSVESVKAASDVYAPVSGTVTEINENLNDSPELVNNSAETDAWFVKLKMNDLQEIDNLLDETAYEEHCEKEA